MTSEIAPNAAPSGASGGTPGVGSGLEETGTSLVFVGDSAMAVLLRSHDWSQTPLGVVEHWSPSLKATLNIILNAPCPMLVAWRSGVPSAGADAPLLFYNDAAAAIGVVLQGQERGDRPTIGQPVAAGWGGGWEGWRSDVAQVFSTGQPLQRQQVNLRSQASPSLDRSTYTWSYSPVWTEAGQVGGVVMTGCREADRPVDTEIYEATQAGQTLLQELTVERARFEAVLRQMPEGVMIADAATGKLILANEQANQILQYAYTLNAELESYEQQVPFRAYRTDGQPYAAEAYPLVRSLQSGEVVTHEEMELRYPDGSYRFIDTNSAPILTPAGDISAAVVVFRDITRRKQAEAKFRENQYFIQQIAETVPGILSVYDLIEQRNIYINRQVIRLLGYTAEQIQAMGANVLPTLIHPEDFARIPAHLETFQKLQDGDILELEYRMQHASGEWRWFYAREVIFGRTADGSPQLILGISEDITDRKQAEELLRQSEERLRLAMDGVQMGTWDVDLKTGRALWSEQHFTVLGYEPTPTGEASEAMWSSRIHPADRQRVIEEWQRSRQERRIYRMDYRVIRADNQQIAWLTALGSFTYDATGEAVRSIGVLFDITEQKQAELALAKQEERYRYIFDAVNVAIWEEDFTQVQTLIEQLKSAGVSDFQQYFADHPEVVDQAVGMVRLRDVNQAALQLFGAENKAELLDSLHHIFTPETRQAFVGELLALAAGDTHLATETVLQTLSGDRINVWFSLTFPSPTNGYDRVLVSMLNISDRKQMEAALRESEERFRNLADNISQFAWMTDASGWIFWYNQRWFDYTGTTLEQMQGWGWRQVHHPDHVDRVVEHFSHCLATGEPWEDTFPIRGRDGTYRWFLSRALPIRGGDGNILRWFGTNTDITERKRTEEALQASEERLRTFVEANVVGIVFCDIWGNIREANDEFLRIVGYTREDFDAGQVRWTELTPSEYLPIDQEAIADAQRTSGTCNPYEKEYIRKDGQRVSVIVGFSLVGETRDEAIAFILDLSDRKKAEAALRQREQRLDLATAAAKLGVFEWNAQLDRAVWENDQMYAIFGHTQEDGTLTESQFYTQVIHPEDRQQFERDFVASMRPNARLHTTCRIQRRNDQQWRWVELSGQFELASDGSPLRLVGVLGDITDRKQAESEREELLARERSAREEAEQANRIKDEFLAVLSHELRSPLNPILGWSKLLQTRRFDEAATRRALETIERNARLQTQLIDDLLDVSRILRGKMVLNVCPVNLATVIDAALETVWLSAQAKTIEIQKVITPGVGPVLGDSGRLQQTIWNLLSNAIKFTPAQGTIEIWLEQVGNEAQIQVIDTGKGIKPEFLPHVFKSFQQEDGTTTRKFGGLGLGLAIVRHLTELHGGRVQAQSPGEGLGATFTLWLPLMKQASDPEWVREDKPEAVDLRQVQILVVDDEEDMRGLLQVILEQQGAQVRVAASAMEALQMIERQPPDILISDIGMPGVDGYMLVRQLRHRPPEQGGSIPAIALTAYAGEYDHQQALVSGFQRHIPKPVEPDALVEAIATLLHQAG